MYYIEDEEIAKNLQRKFNSSSVDSPVRRIDKENVKLTDSILEYHDPTPNIHDLFVLFDKKFFWGKLGMVEVKWSNRMTTCAGLCYYQGKRGLCSIKLSAPLLSLRPRKDLVETLLHEMIHAYLFVTQNYRDREDHGPEFHKHMHRINQQAGTKISVYHTFLDEVAYYQKHIWRCNGPCQSRRPFYGFVKRAMNRAPGPNDTWWSEHQRNCGGTFIKVSEPQKTCKKKARHEKDKSEKPGNGVKDIRDFFSTGTPQKSPASKEQVFKSSNIHTFKDLEMATSPTNVIAKPISQPYIIPKVVKTEIVKPTIKIEEKKGDVNESARVKATVRNFWSSKYPSPNAGTKRLNSTSPIMPTEVTIEMKRRQLPCPVCHLSFSETMINEHVEECLLKGKSKQSFDDTLPMDELMKRNVASASQWKSQEEDGKFKLAQCPVCSKAMDQKDLNDHLEICLKCKFENEGVEKDDDVVCEVVPCPCCLKWVPESTINNHIDECLTFIALKSSLKND